MATTKDTASDAILDADDWISPYYFNSGGKGTFSTVVADRRKAWDKAARESLPTSRSRWMESSRELTEALHRLADDPASAPQFHELLLTVLGYRSGGHQLTTNGPVRRFATTGVVQDAPLAVVEALPVDDAADVLDRDGHTLDPWAAPEELSGTTREFTSVARLVSALFVAEGGPSFVLVLAGRWAVVAEQRRWAEGRYLAVDLQTVLERADSRRGGEIDKALTCLDAESLAPDETGEVWWAQILAESVAHTVGVSADLREGVRVSIETIANEVVARRRELGLDPLGDDQAQPLAMQSLRFLYRILFLLYAEAAPELGVLPVGAPEYDNGYSLARLRELVQVPIVTEQVARGTHLYDSLAVLFRLVDEGHQAQGPAEGVDGDLAGGLTFRNLRADLFLPRATALIDEVGLGNRAMQKVLTLLLLSKQQRGRERGFISYAELGINQLGAVYEGLMSYTGFFAHSTLFEVARGGDPSKGSWVVPEGRETGINPKDFVMVPDERTGQPHPRRYSRGEFVFRLSGRARQQSASFYTPEVLTRFVVGQALAELLDEHTPADDILDLRICEPALGSGAFVIEAVRQLAEQYLERKQVELGQRIEPDEYPAQLQRTKAAIALHQVYGVDLNATAVEFAEITLWLDTMTADLAAPWFGLHLRRGNSLIGARRAVYSPAQLADKSWLTTAPTDVPLTDIASRVTDPQAWAGRSTEAGGQVLHWLVPAQGWGATADSKEARELAGDRVASVKAWRKGVRRKLTRKQVGALVDIGYQVEELWTMAYRRLVVAEQQSRRPIRVWGQPEPSDEAVVSREQIEASLADPQGAYQRLRRVMDAWCAMWFWPLTGEEVAPPSVDQWIDAVSGLLGRRLSAERCRSTAGADTLSGADEWAALADEERFNLSGAGARPVDEVLADHPWLRVCEQVAADQGFFHWQLDFAPVFGRGGFDLQVGNPPWVRPMIDVDALLAERDPWWQLAVKPSESQRDERRPTTLEIPGLQDLVLDGIGDVSGAKEYLGDATNYPHLVGLRPDLYRCFMEQVWTHARPSGVSALLHPESHFTDERAGVLRAATYQRLRRHWQFVNELLLFTEVGDRVTYGVHVYASKRPPAFLHASGLYHPETVLNSYRHDGSGPEPGFKVDGHWDTRAHASRIQRVTSETLAVWHDMLESDDAPVEQSRMVYAVNREVADVLAKVARADRVRSLGLNFSGGWNESIDRSKGYFVRQWGTPTSWSDVILQGPHLHVANPAYKQPNPTMKSKEDWSPIDLEHLAADAIPITSYKPAGPRGRYDADYTHWDDGPARNFYRIAWRAMASNTGERTLIPAIIPPGASHPNGVFCMGSPRVHLTPVVAGASASLISDFAVRSAPKSGIYQGVFGRLPLPPLDHPLIPALVLRTLRLNCLTEAYAELWAQCWDDAFTADSWTTREHAFTPLGEVEPTWSVASPLRRDADRRQALVEIDALVAVMLGITADELCTVYRTQFAVLHDYDTGLSRRTKYYFDANGRLVPTSVQQKWRSSGDLTSQTDRTATNAEGHKYTYELPFQLYDREADLRRAHQVFTDRLA